ncbi:hypothetical protein OpiT1DRAFT_01950 [Opitutaceae bacterium TAV1]|nr:hypothetical protein OpiT1DRAFT_01950 [Opitutaceae bacterium TAV1]
MPEGRREQRPDLYSGHDPATRQGMAFQRPFNVRQIAALQAELTVRWHGACPPAVEAAGDEFDGLVVQNHLYNFQLWHEEDVARRDDLGFERVYQAKRSIDRYNQRRNDMIEEMDKALVIALEPPESGCPRNSETPGMIIDRLSILALKEYHMAEETRRADVEAAHRESCAAKLERIVRQRDDLTESLATLLEDVIAGRRTFAVYYQFKMYNDPALNPQLYRRSKMARRSSRRKAARNG